MSDTIAVGQGTFSPGWSHQPELNIFLSRTLFRPRLLFIFGKWQKACSVVVKSPYEACVMLRWILVWGLLGWAHPHRGKANSNSRSEACWSVKLIDHLKFGTHVGAYLCRVVQSLWAWELARVITILQLILIGIIRWLEKQQTSREKNHGFIIICLPLV
jgi:hypothetical protein